MRVVIVPSVADICCYAAWNNSIIRRYVLFAPVHLACLPDVELGPGLLSEFSIAANYIENAPTVGRRTGYWPWGTAQCISWQDENQQEMSAARQYAAKTEKKYQVTVNTDTGNNSWETECVDA